MARLLIVEDEPDQMLLRRLILERAGHAVTAVSTPAQALEAVRSAPAAEAFEGVVMDLRLPAAEDGLRLIRGLRALAAGLPIVVLSGRLEEFSATPESGQVAAALAKPVRTESLLRTLSRLAAPLCLALLSLLPASGQAREFSFQVPSRGEVIAELRLASPGSDWEAAGREAAMATLTLDGSARQQVMIYGGPSERLYAVFLGELQPGSHTLRVERDAALSAKGSGLSIAGAMFQTLAPADPRALAIAHAPVLLARADTVGRFTDVPLLAYYTEGRDGSGPFLEYTIIFSNEDGGTSTRDLMARWGRTSDIEYIYRVWLDARGEPARTLIQTRDHRDVPYEGQRFGRHPVLVPVTDNNMVEPAPPGPAAVRYQFVPVRADLEGGSREIVMDQNPVTYLVSAKELAREDKLRPNGAFEGEKIADPRHYLVVEMKVRSENAAIQILLRRRNAALWQGSAVGIGKDHIERSGWARTAIELPPGTKLSGIAEIGAQCISRRDLERQPVPKNGHCRLEAFGKVFFLGEDYAPLPPLALPALPAGGWPLKVGEMRTVTLP